MDFCLKKPPSRIQRPNRATILEAALDVFSSHGFRGAMLDLIAKKSGAFKTEHPLLL